MNVVMSKLNVLQHHTINLYEFFTFKIIMLIRNEDGSNNFAVVKLILSQISSFDFMVLLMTKTFSGQEIDQDFLANIKARNSSSFIRILAKPTPWNVTLDDPSPLPIENSDKIATKQREVETTL